MTSLMLFSLVAGGGGMAQFSHTAKRSYRARWLVSFTTRNERSGSDRDRQEDGERPQGRWCIAERGIDCAKTTGVDAIGEPQKWAPILRDVR